MRSLVLAIAGALLFTISSWGQAPTTTSSAGTPGSAMMATSPRSREGKLRVHHARHKVHRKHRRHHRRRAA